MEDLFTFIINTNIKIQSEVQIILHFYWLFWFIFLFLWHELEKYQIKTVLADHPRLSLALLVLESVDTVVVRIMNPIQL